MKAVIYARYSSDNQREESIEGQIRECNEYATFNDIQVVGNYIDRAYSAKTDNRPEFQRMIKDSYKHAFNCIIVWKLDRFSRNRYDSAHYKALLRKNGVKVVSAKESVAEGSEGHNLSISRYIEKKLRRFFELAKKENLEGIVAKKKDGQYHIGKRTSEWIKIKVIQDEDLLVLGYQPDDDGKVKDLILGYYDESCVLQCRGKVYLGVSKAEQKIIAEFAKKNTVKDAWFDKYKNVVWLKPQLVGTAHFMHETESGGMCQPVWKGLTDDK